PLSESGVELALTEHLELEPSIQDRKALMAAAGQADVVHVLLSANVFVGALRALALAAVAAPHVVVRMSRRESVFARHLLDAVDKRAFGYPIEIVDSLMIPNSCEGEAHEVHLYGSNSTIVQVASSLPEFVRIRAHGSGLGLAVVETSCSTNDAAQAVAASMIPFDQRGCLSPRIALVHGDESRAWRFSQALLSCLERAGTKIPLGDLLPEERAERARYQDICRMAGTLFDSPHGCVGLTGGSLWIPPIGRNMHVLACQPAEVETVLRPWLRRIVAAVGIAGGDGGDLATMVQRVVPKARVSAADRMQKPPLDGPVDRRTPEPLAPSEVIRIFRDEYEGG
ncbi:MAG TPA: acyl-CoA reductase, partial [Polyangiaceae bacterium]|nr:acyl-CoA reductase [Polyangiaceae bacterium]